MEQPDKLEFVTYRKYKSIFDTAPLVEILSAAGIEFEIENASPSVDITFSANPSQDEFRVKIAPANFERADTLLQANAEEIMKQIDSDYYLFSFSDSELVEILEKPDEWSNEDYFFARKILQDRKIAFSDEHLEQMKKNRLEFLRRPSKEPKGLIIAGWFFAFAGGLFGLIVGWYLKEFRRTLFNGERIWEYDEQTRKKGVRILKTGLFVHVVLLFTYILNLIIPFI